LENTAETSLTGLTYTENGKFSQIFIQAMFPESANIKFFEESVLENTYGLIFSMN
jgi:hypothetical protein